MTQLHFLTVWGIWAGGTAFWSCLTWPLVVRFIWPWWKDAWGWNMVIKTEMISLALLASTLHYEFGVKNISVLLWTTVFAITAIPSVLLWRTWLIWRTQRTVTLAEAVKNAAAAPVAAEPSAEQ